MITLTREEAQQVLDALEPIALYKAYNGDDWPARQVMPAIKTLRARLSEHEQTIQQFAEKLAAEQEPMKQKTDLLFSTATMQDRHDAMLGRLEKTLERVKQEAQQKEQEPVAWFVDDEKGFELSGVEIPGWKPLYAAPPKREWQGLTDYEIEVIHRSAWVQSTATLGDFACAIEMALKEKNT